MEKFVIDFAEKEGHFEFFKERQLIWNFIKEERLDQLCHLMEAKHKDLMSKWAKKRDGLVHCQIEWSKWLSGLKDSDTME